jgi:hypothetical protein
MTPIPKPGRENRNDASKYRPISLINVGGKVLEKILINRIMHYLNKNNLMNKNQFGFTPGKGTTDAILAVKDFIEEGLQQRHITILISLDVKSAFDAAFWPSIIYSLKEFNCPENLYNLAKSYFSERKVTLYSNNKKIEREASKGCPQGSCSGPVFLNIQYNSLLNLDFGKRTKAAAFADDLLIAIKAESAIEAENFANFEIGKITKWAEDNKIMFNEQKSKVMVITRRKRREKTDVSIYLNSCPLEQVTSIKYLGVILDNKLNFREHLISTARKCTTLIHTLSKSAKLNWGLQQGALNTIYKGAILPLLTYATPVWIRAMERNYNRTLYTRVQRLINITIAKAYRTTSNEALCILTGNAPIIIKYLQRSHFTPPDICRTSLDKSHGKKQQQNPLHQVTTANTHQNSQGLPNDFQ